VVAIYELQNQERCVQYNQQYCNHFIMSLVSPMLSMKEVPSEKEKKKKKESNEYERSSIRKKLNMK
jgi:hypothetical protein